MPSTRVQEMFAFSQQDVDDSSSSDDEVTAGPSWMNKFAPQPTTMTTTTAAATFRNTTPNSPATTTNVTMTTNNGSAVSPNMLFFETTTKGEPAWMHKFGGGAGNANNFNDSATSFSSSTHSFRAEETPEWMQKLKRRGSLQQGGSMHESQHGQSTLTNHLQLQSAAGSFFSTQPAVTPSTPGWRKQRGTTVGAPSVPSVPSLNTSNHSITTPAWRKSTLNNSISSIASDAPNQHAPAPETPSWMKKFDVTKQADGPLHDDDDDDDDRSVSSFTSARSNADPEWMLRFNNKKKLLSTTNSGSGYQQLPNDPTAAAAKPGAEPEWMKRFQQIDMSEEQPSLQFKSPTKTTGAPPRPPQSSHFSSSPGKFATKKPGPPRGMASAPSSPSSTRYAITVSNASSVGAMSAPSSPVTAVGLPRAGSRSCEKPSWMQKLIQKKQGNDLPEEKQRSNKTPPWKQRERLKEEQARELRESLGLDMGVEEGAEDEEGDLSDGEWGPGDDSSAEEEEVPEWMQQFRKMDLKAARVVSAQGKAPQTVASLRTGCANMTERTGDVVDDSQVVKAISVRSHSSRSLKLSRHSSFKNGKMKKDISKRSLAASEDISESSFAEQDHSKPGGIARVPNYQVEVSTTMQPRSEHSTATTSEASSVGEGKESSPLDYRSLHSTDLSVFSAQVEIDNSAPENVMSKWGKTVNAKKPGNSTLMSWRMIQNQAEKVKERIEKAKNGSTSTDEKSTDKENTDVAGGQNDAPNFDESATALFFGGADKKSSKNSNSFSMDNSAANLFGFSAGGSVDKKTTKNSNSFSMDSSAANVFGFETGNGSTKVDTAESANMENSAALLFGFGSEKEGTTERKEGDHLGGTGGGAEGPQSTQEAKRSDHPQGQGSLSNFLNGSGSGWPKNDANAIKEGDDESSSSSGGNEKKKDKKPALFSYEPRSFATTAAVVTPQTRVEPKKKAFVDDSDSDDSDSDDNGVNKAKKSAAKDIAAAKSTDDGDANQSARVAKAASVAPPQRKKSFLDDSDSDDDSSSDESTPRRPSTKGRLYAPNKTESTIPLMAGKATSKDAENPIKESEDDSSSDESPPSRPPTKGKPYAPNKTESTIPLMAGKTTNKDAEDSDSDSDDSSSAPSKATKHSDDVKPQPLELNAFPDDVAEKFDSSAEAQTAETPKVPEPQEPIAFPDDCADGFGNFAFEKGKESADLPVDVEEKKVCDMITSDSASKTTDIPSESTRPAQPAETSVPVDAIEMSKDDAPMKEIPPDVPEVDHEPALAAVEVPEDKLEEGEWQAALMGLAEEKQKNDEEEQWQSALLKIQSELEEERRLASSPKAQVKPKNKAKPIKKEEKKKEATLQIKKNAAKPPKKEDIKKEESQRKGKKKDVPDKIDTGDKKKSSKEASKPAKGGEKGNRKRASSKDPTKRNSEKESKEPKSLSGSSKKKGAVRGRTENMESPTASRTSRSKSSDHRQRDKSKERSSMKSNTKSGKRPSKPGLPPMTPSKPKKGPLKPKSMATIPIKPKSSSKIASSKPKSSANLVIKPKSRISLVPTVPKSKTSLIPSNKPKSKKISPADFADDDSFVMNDFDDDFSALPDFGDFAEDGSVVPLKAVRNPPSVKRGGKKSGSKADSKSKKKSTKDGSKAGKDSKASKSKSKDKKKSDKKAEKKPDKKKGKKK